MYMIVHIVCSERDASQKRSITKSRVGLWRFHCIILDYNTVEILKYVPGPRQSPAYAQHNPIFGALFGLAHGKQVIKHFIYNKN